MRAALALTALALAVPSQLPARGQPEALPQIGFAVQTAAGVVLVDPAGHVVRTLAGYRLRDEGVERPGQVELRDAAGRDFELRGGQITSVPRDFVTLPHGWSVQFSSGWIVRQGQRVVVRYAATTRLGLDASGSLLSAVPRTGAFTLVRDLRNGRLVRRATACAVGALIGATEYDLCGYPFVKGEQSTIVRRNAGGRRVLAGPAGRGPNGPAGSWRELLPGPSGSPLLAQWSGTCEVTAAYLVNRTSGALTLLGDRSAHRVQGFVLGWLGATPFTALPSSACTSSAAPPGIYAYDATGRALLVYRLPTRPGTTVRLWR